jgi:hypothetical protein
MRKISTLVMILLFVISMCAVSVVTVPVAAEPEKNVLQRPIEDFIDAQGTFWGPNYYVAWLNNEYILHASVDFAGLDNEWIKAKTGGAVDLGTTFSGTITEKPLDDGRTLVHVNLHTKNALTWVYDYSKGKVIFGSYPNWVATYGWPASLADCRFDITYITTDEPGAPMLDMFQLIFFPEVGQEVVQNKFVASSKGELNGAFGVPQGTPGMVQIAMSAPLNAPGMWTNGHHMPYYWPAGNINVKEIGN